MKRSQNKENEKLYFPSKRMKTYKYMSISMKIKKLVTELLKMYATRNIAIQIWKSWQFLTIWYKIPKFWHFPWNFAIFSKSWQFLTILTVWTPCASDHFITSYDQYQLTIFSEECPARLNKSSNGKNQSHQNPITR